MLSQDEPVRETVFSENYPSIKSDTSSSSGSIFTMLVLGSVRYIAILSQFFQFKKPAIVKIFILLCLVHGGTMLSTRPPTPAPKPAKAVDETIPMAVEETIPMAVEETVSTAVEETVSTAVPGNNTATKCCFFIALPAFILTAPAPITYPPPGNQFIYKPEPERWHQFGTGPAPALAPAPAPVPAPAPAALIVPVTEPETKPKQDSTRTEKYDGESLQSDSGIKNGTKKSRQINTMNNFEQDFMKVIASVNTVLAAASVSLNICIIKHFANGRHISANLYHKNGLMDLMCGLGFLLQVPPIFNILETKLPMAMIFTSYLVTTVAVRGSTFTNLVLSSVRCINILSPFFLVKKRGIAISIIAYIVIWTAIAGFDIYTFVSIPDRKYVYALKTFDLKPELGFGLRVKIFGDRIVAYGILAIFYYGIPVLLPCFLSVVLMALQIWSLLKSGGPTKVISKTSNAAAKGSAMTILLLTLIYITTSLLSIVAWLGVYRDQLLVKEFKALNYTELGIVYISTSTCPLLCSTLSPLILLVRGVGFRTAVRRWLGMDRNTNNSEKSVTASTDVSKDSA